MNVMESMGKLIEIRSYCGKIETVGLEDTYVEQFLTQDQRLGEVIEDAWVRHQDLRTSYQDVLAMSEADQVKNLQGRLVNFYEPATVNPYVGLAAKGPWIITTGGAVIHDSGGYGMLGLGHNPDLILHGLGRPQVMANVMTPSFSHWKLSHMLDEEIGHKRNDGTKYSGYIFMNSGSEAVTVACRISDRNARLMTDPGGRHAAKRIMFLSLKKSFHGRTDRPAQVSDSSLPRYKEFLASFRDRDNLLTVEMNDLEGLEKVFATVEKQNIFLEAMFIEPVQGEGNPGKAITPAFYKRACELTRKHGSLLIVDSIQAGLRAHGCLSIVDYPGFEGLAYPDMETFSKALNGGQFPFSVLAMNDRSAQLYKQSTYGNTMTANPRGMETACLVLESFSPKMRDNIRRQGKRFLKEFSILAEKFPNLVDGIQGTGLLFSISLREEACKVVGWDGMEIYLRRNGIGVIHGGKNALRFTPHFAISDAEIDLMITVLEKAFKRFSVGGGD